MRKIRVVLALGIFVVALVSVSALSLVKPHSAYAGCGGPFPPKPAQVWAKSGPKAGQVTLYWDEVAYANRYAVAYGQMSGKYIYGADNIGGSQSRSYTIMGLQPGARYVFVLAAAHDCASSPFSHEVWASAAGGYVSQTPSAGIVAPSTSSWSKTMMTSTATGSVGAQMLWTKSGPGVGQVTLYWKNADNADDYHLMYGMNSGDYQYGALNIGNTTSFTVKSLVPGRRYYFALVPLMGDRSLYTTSAVAGWAYRPVVVEVEVEVPAQDIPQPVPQEGDGIGPQTYTDEEVEIVYEADTLDDEDDELDDDFEDVQGVSDEYVYDDDSAYDQSDDVIDEAEYYDDDMPRLGDPEGY